MFLFLGLSTIGMAVARGGGWRVAGVGGWVGVWVGVGVRCGASSSGVYTRGRPRYEEMREDEGGRGGGVEKRREKRGRGTDSDDDDG